MINNGTVHYNNDKDGADTQLGGNDAGCEVKVRNKDHDTQVLIRYVGDTLTVRIFWVTFNYVFRSCTILKTTVGGSSASKFRVFICQLAIISDLLLQLAI
jgi:hypothetical protein